MSDHTHSELEQLRIEVMRLTRRIDDLEGSVLDLRGAQIPLEPLAAPVPPAPAPAAAPATEDVPGMVDLAPEPVMEVSPRRAGRAPRCRTADGAAAAEAASGATAAAV